MTAPNFAALDKLAEARAWQRGALAWLMLATQRQALAAMNASTFSVFVVLCSRRWGKTVFAVLTVWIVALTKPGAILRYAAPTKNHGRQFVIPAMRWLAEQAPEHLRPRFAAQDNTWHWPNGSVCHLGSCESDADVDAQVGTECHYAVIDEAGKIRSSLLRKLIRSIILPQFLTTRGKVCVLGTPPESPEHYFRDLVTDAQARGSLVKHTIDHCTHIDAKALAELVAELGGRNSTEARRELDCEFVTEKARAIVPEFAANREHIIRDDIERPRNFDAYVAADMGFNDLSVAGLGYYHFALDALVIEDEVVCQHLGGVEVARLIRAKEIELWGTERQPLRRWADTTLQTIADIRQGTSRDEHGKETDPVIFSLPAKHDATAALNRLRTKIGERRILIHSRCKTILAHLEYGIWNQARTGYERTDSHHWDGIPAVTYLLRAVDWGRNPAPLVEAHDRNTHAVSPRVYPEYRAQQQDRRNGGAPKTFADLHRR